NPMNGAVPALDAPGGDLDTLWSTDVPIQLDAGHNGHLPSAPLLLQPADGAPVVQVHCFGDLTVRSGEREITPYGEEGPSFKAWELLAFLASQPGGTIARAKLLNAVWRDVEERKAANRMRVAM